ncbi:hypothetical protein ABBQ38_013619 [Trebouxia sp. C0009 RCD-2024]
MIRTPHCMHGSLPATLAGSPFKALLPVNQIRVRSCQASQRRTRLRVCAENQSEQDQAPAVQMSKRALIASLALVAIIPLQATQVLALRDSKTVFVAGATGNTGKRVVQQLSSKGIKVLAGTRDPKKAEGLGWGDTVKLVTADVTSDATELAAAMKGADAVICAIGSSGFNPKGPRTVDYEGTLHLVDAAKRAGVKKFVLMSSLLTNGRDAGQGTNPNFVVLNLFGGVLDQKLKAEKYLRGSGLDWTIVRWAPCQHTPLPPKLQDASQRTPGTIPRLLLPWSMKSCDAMVFLMYCLCQCDCGASLHQAGVHQDSNTFCAWPFPV